MTQPQDEPGGQRCGDDRLVFGAHWGLLAFFAGIGTYYVLAALAGLFVNGWSGPGTALTELGPVLLLAFLPTLSLGLGPVIGAARWGGGVRTAYRFVPNRRDLRVGVVCGIFAIFAGYVLNWVMIATYGSDELETPLGDIREGLGNNIVWLVVAMVILVLAAPLAEEFLARGALWSALEHYRIPPWAILALTSVVFALLHAEPARTVALLGQGVAIGAARMITGRVGASAVAHATNNLPPALLLIVVGAA